MKIFKKTGIFIVLVLFFMSVPNISDAKNEKLHPMNKRLIDLGYMPFPKYFPEIPRIPVHYAKKLWEEGEARFILVSYQDKELIVGAVHLDNEVPPFDISRFRLISDEQVIVVY